MKTAATILAIGANGAVVQLPERKFPGVVIQGDSLSILLSDLQELRAAIASKNASEAQSLVDTMEATLQSRIEFYERTLEAAGLALPYSRRSTIQNEKRA